MTPELKKSILAFEDFLNEPPQYEDKRMVRDYRHAAYGRWSELRDKITAALSPPEPTEGQVEPFIDQLRGDARWLRENLPARFPAIDLADVANDLEEAARLLAARAMPLQEDRPQLIEMLRVSGANLETAAFVLDRRGDPEHAAVMRKAAAQILPLLAEDGISETK